MATHHAVINQVTFTTNEKPHADSNYLHSGILIEKRLFLGVRNGLIGTSPWTCSAA